MVKLINASIRVSKYNLCFLTAIALLLGFSNVGYSEESNICVTSEEKSVLPSDFDNMMVLGNAEEIPETLDVTLTVICLGSTACFAESSSGHWRPGPTI